MTLIIKSKTAQFTNVLPDFAETPAPIGHFKFGGTLAASKVNLVSGGVDLIDFGTSGISFGADYINLPQNNASANFLRFEDTDNGSYEFCLAGFIDGVASTAEIFAFSPNNTSKMTVTGNDWLFATSTLDGGTNDGAFLIKPYPYQKYAVIMRVRNETTGSSVSIATLGEDGGYATSKVYNDLPLATNMLNAYMIDIGRHSTGDLRLYEAYMYSTYVSDAAAKGILDKLMADNI
jgi:hypothetical protein